MTDKISNQSQKKLDSVEYIRISHTDIEVSSNPINSKNLEKKEKEKHIAQKKAGELFVLFALISIVIGIFFSFVFAFFFFFISTFCMICKFQKKCGDGSEYSVNNSNAKYKPTSANYTRYTTDPAYSNLPSNIHHRN